MHDSVTQEAEVLRAGFPEHIYRRAAVDGHHGKQGHHISSLLLSVF